MIRKILDLPEPLESRKCFFELFCSFSLQWPRRQQTDQSALRIVSPLFKILALALPIDLSSLDHEMTFKN